MFFVFDPNSIPGIQVSPNSGTVFSYYFTFHYSFIKRHTLSDKDHLLYTSANKYPPCSIILPLFFCSHLLSVHITCKFCLHELCDSTPKKGYCFSFQNHWSIILSFFLLVFSVLLADVYSNLWRNSKSLYQQNSNRLSLMLLFVPKMIREDKRMELISYFERSLNLGNNSLSCLSESFE